MHRLSISRRTALPGGKTIGGSLRRLALTAVLRLTLVTLHLSLLFASLVTALSAQGITPQSIITTVAGTDFTFRGDGGPATDAPLGQIRDVAVDSSGNVFVSDNQNRQIEKISPDGILSVVAGKGI